VEPDAVSALLAILAAIFFALAATLWQKATLSLDEVSFKRPKSFLLLLANWVWLLGLVSQGVAVVLQGAALDRGPLALVQPLLVTTIIFALPLGYFLTGQQITRRQVIGALAIVAGLALFGIYGDPAEGVDNIPNSQWFATFVILGALCWGLLLFANRGGPTATAAVYGTVAGVLYGISATLMNSVVADLHTEGWDVLTNWQLYALGATGIGGFLVQQLSLSTGRLAASVATVSVTNPVISVILGALLFQERLDSDPTWHRTVAVGGLALALLGTAIISSAREKESEEEQPVEGEKPTVAEGSPA
jgi:drug/metabolite transporter (DMT)-like permease